MNTIDYIDKMMDILKDETKFKCLGGVTEYDRTPQVEGQIVKRLLKLLKRGELSKEVYDRIKPVGLTLLQPMGARGEDDEPTNGRSD